MIPAGVSIAWSAKASLGEDYRGRWCDQRPNATAAAPPINSSEAKNVLARAKSRALDAMTRKPARTNPRGGTLLRAYTPCSR
jgi:hypothetical protein